MRREKREGAGWQEIIAHKCAPEAERMLAHSQVSDLVWMFACECSTAELDLRPLTSSLQVVLRQSY